MVLCIKTDKANIKKEDAQKVLGDYLYFDLLEIEPEICLINLCLGILRDATQ